MNKLDQFVPNLVKKIDLARSKGLPRFKCWHPNGDRIEVTLENGKVQATRYNGNTDLVMVKLATTYDQLQRDLVTGITSKQATELRG